MNGALLSSKKMDYCTPQDFFAELDREFHFALDAAATEASAKCPAYYTPETDGLNSPWNIAGGCCILQPAVWPGDRQVGTQGLEEAQGGTTIVLLIPARTDTSYFTSTFTARRKSGGCAGGSGSRTRTGPCTSGAVPLHGGGLQREGAAGHES